MDFNIELAKQLLNSDNKFPVNFDLAWQWIGYSRKDSAKRSLLNAGFIENVDLHIDVEPITAGISGDANENILLSVECFKMWAMMAKTSQGRKVREYFIECERIAKQTIAPKKEQPKLGVSVEQTIAILNPLKLVLSSLPAPLVDGFVLNQVQKYHPELKAAINDAHSLLAATTAIPEVLLTPTAIGKRLEISARTVNLLLTAHGFQVRNTNSQSKTEPAYLPTEKGKAYSSNTIATGRCTDNTSYQHTKWQESIVEVLRELI